VQYGAFEQARRIEQVIRSLSKHRVLCNEHLSRERMLEVFSSYVCILNTSLNGSAYLIVNWVEVRAVWSQKKIQGIKVCRVLSTQRDVRLPLRYGSDGH